MFWQNYPIELAPKVELVPTLSKKLAVNWPVWIGVSNSDSSRLKIIDPSFKVISRLSESNVPSEPTVIDRVCSFPQLVSHRSIPIVLLESKLATIFWSLPRLGLSLDLSSGPGIMIRLGTTFSCLPCSYR